jgi:hypothetical protein
MRINIYGCSYDVAQPQLAPIFLELLEDENTFIFYITEDKKVEDLFDTILLINTSEKKIYPLFLSTFKEMVRNYDFPLKNEFPAWAIIEAAGIIDYELTSFDKIKNDENVQTNRRIAYSVKKACLSICPVLTAEEFVSIRTRKEFSNKTHLLNKFYSQPIDIELSDEYKNEKTKDKSEVKRPIIIDPQTSKKNLEKFLKLKPNTIAIVLLNSDEIVVLDKHTGQHISYSFEKIISNDTIGYKTSQEIFDSIGPSLKIIEPVESINLLDVRSMIRYLEKRKEDSLTNKLIAVDNNKAYIALCNQEKCGKISIKNYIIECHKNSNVLYDKLKTDLQMYSSDLYLLLCASGSVIFAYDQSSKTSKKIDINDVYKLYPNLEDIGDISRLFPMENVINGTALNIQDHTTITGMAAVQSNALKLLGDTITIKNKSFAYESYEKVVLVAIH